MPAVEQPHAVSAGLPPDAPAEASLDGAAPALSLPDHPAADLVTPAIDLPAAVPAWSRLDTASLAAAVLVHLTVVVVALQPGRVIGSGGDDLDAIGIDIVTTAPALEARSGNRERARASAAAIVDASDGAADPAPAERPAADSRQAIERTPTPTAPPPADLAVPQWVEPERPADAKATEPIIASTKADGDATETATPLRPTVVEPVISYADSIPAAALLERQQGGAAARGRDDVSVEAAAIAAARAGRRDAYGTAVFEALRANAPRRIPGIAGKVTIEFTLTPTGAIASARVAISSGRGELDQAALAAVRTTRFPAPPGGVGLRDLIYAMPYTFN